MKILWKITNSDGASLTGFHSEEEAKKILPYMKENKDWKIIIYKADDFNN